MQYRVTDVLVVGGGTAGVTAALSAAQSGAKVTLVERDGALGGVATRAGIHLYYYGHNAGLQRELDHETDVLAGGIGAASQGFHPDAKRLVTTELLDQAGVELIFHSLAVDVEMDDARQNVLGVLFEQPGGRLKVSASVTIDATGDGDVCALAGVPFTLGRSWDGVTNNYSLVARHVYNGRIGPINTDGGWVDSTSARDVSRAYIEGRRLLFEMLGERLQHDAFVAIAPHLGVREGRQVEGEYVIQLGDLILDRRFDDVVMRCVSHYDTHAYDFANESLAAQVWVCVMGLWKQKIGCDVPYRAFIPKGVDGLLIGCRAISQTHDAAAALRMQRDVQQMGEVAGTAAAMSCILGCAPRQLDVRDLQQRLIEQGVLEPQDLARESMPWVQPKLPGVPTPISLNDLSNEVYIEALIDALDTEDGGKALWWLLQGGERAVDPLLTRLHRAAGEQARSIALALALLGRADGANHLLRSIQDRESETPPGIRAAPRWIASLIGLKSLRDPRAVDCLLERLPSERDTDSLLHILHYLIAIGDLIRAESDRSRLHRALLAVLDWPERGEAYQVWGGATRSMKWSIDVAIAWLFVTLGDGRGYRILEAYANDARGYVRRAAARVRENLERDMQPSKGRASG